MATVVVVVPDRPGGIVAGSGVVCATTPTGPTVVSLEGNLYAAANIVTFADRVYQAADRLLRGYPTSAVRTLPAAHLLVLGSFDTVTGTVTLAGDRERGILADWLGFDQVDPGELETTCADHVLARLRHPSGLSGHTLQALAERLVQVQQRSDIELLDLVRVDPTDVQLGGPLGSVPGLAITVAFTYTSGRRQRRTARLAWPIRRYHGPGEADPNLPACIWADLNRRIGGAR
jgi:hypothetical protein